MRDLTSPNDIDDLLREPEAVLLKHGARCPISAAAREALDDFAADHPDARVYRVEVTEHRALSDDLAERLGVAHESPQALVLRGGRPVWRASRLDISAAGLARALRE
jgi:bacillithiol system protein YtxJ